MSIVNVHLSGDLEMFVEKYIKRGMASTKAEVIRQGLIRLKKEESFEDISDDPELAEYLRGIKSGKKPKLLGPVKNLGQLIK